MYVVLNKLHMTFKTFLKSCSGNSVYHAILQMFGQLSYFLPCLFGDCVMVSLELTVVLVAMVSSGGCPRYTTSTIGTCPLSNLATATPSICMEGNTKGCSSSTFLVALEVNDKLKQSTKRIKSQSLTIRRLFLCIINIATAAFGFPFLPEPLSSIIFNHLLAFYSQCWRVWRTQGTKVNYAHGIRLQAGQDIAGNVRAWLDGR